MNIRRGIKKSIYLLLYLKSFLKLNIMIENKNIIAIAPIYIININIAIIFIFTINNNITELKKKKINQNNEYIVFSLSIQNM